MKKYCIICGAKTTKYDFCKEHRKHYFLDSDGKRINRISRWSAGKRFDFVGEVGEIRYWFGTFNPPSPAYFSCDAPNEGSPNRVWCSLPYMPLAPINDLTPFIGVLEASGGNPQLIERLMFIKKHGTFAS